MASLWQIIHSKGDTDTVAKRASALLPVIVATARWEIGQGDHPIYKDMGPWVSGHFNEGRLAAGMKPLDYERVLRSVSRIDSEKVRTCSPGAI